MTIQAAALITVATLCLSAGVHGVVQRNDLRITGGLCQTARNDGCTGRSTRGGQSAVLFQKLGRTKSELESKGWKLLNSSAGCENSGKFNGFLWIQGKEERISHAVLLDKKGIVAGMQFLMPYDEVDRTSQFQYKYVQQPAIQNVTFGDVDYLYITVYFMDPRQICRTGRDESTLQREGTVSQLYIQTGPSPTTFKQLALNQPPKDNEMELMEGWNDNNCWQYMGWHRFYKQETWDKDECGTFLPFFLMYDKKEGGELNGFGFLIPGKASSPSIELPPLGLLLDTAGTNNNTDEVPKCLTKAFEALGMSSLHVFLMEKPYEFRCPWQKSQSNHLHLSEWHSETTENSFSPKKVVLQSVNIIIDWLHSFSNSLQSSSENERSSSENERSSSENERPSSENERSSSENERSSSENERSSSENERWPSENERSSSENESSENGRLSSRPDSQKKVSLTPSDFKYPVCVIGSGFTGIGVGIQLKKRNIKFEVFEKNENVGGKVNSLRVGDDVLVQMGPLFISPANKHIKKYIEHFNLTKVSFNKYDRAGYSIEDMKVQDIVKTDQDRYNILMAVEEYLRLYKKIKPKLKYGYTEPGVKELFVPMKTWMINNKNWEPLKGIFTLLITNKGYGDLEEVPAIYALQHLNEDKFAALINPKKQSSFIVKEGLDVLIKKMADFLGNNVHLNYAATKIDRIDDNHQTITFSNSKTQECSRVVIAFPPLLPNLKKLMTLDESEVTVLGKVSIHKYISAALSIPSWNRTMYVEALPLDYNANNRTLCKPVGTGEPIAFLKQTIPGKRDHIYSAYSWIKGDFDTNAIEADLAKINQTLTETVNKIDSKGTGKSEVLSIQNNEYFPHANIENLKSGFYEDLKNLQGKKGTFYASTIFNFEVIDKALEAAKKVVKQILQK